MYFARTFRALSAFALLAAPLLSACSEDLGTQESALVPLCTQAPLEVIASYDFSSPLGAGFKVVSDKPQLDPDHSWTVVDGKLLSDPAGFTVSDYYNRLDTPAMDLTGKSDVRIRIRHRYQHTGLYQIFAFDTKGNRSLIREFGGANPDYPNFRTDEITIPAPYAGEAGVRLSILVWSGGKFGSRAGIEIDDLTVSAGSQTGDIVFFDNFEGSLDKWRVFNDPQPGSPDHMWALASGGHPCFNGYVRTDSPMQGTIAPNYTRLETLPFSLVGKTSAQLSFQRSFQLTANSRFQIFLIDNSSNNRGLLAEYLGTGPSFPGADNVVLNLPSYVMGSSSVQVAFLLLSSSVGDAGIALDNVAVTAK